jgi:hypothetical protein
MTNTQHDYAKKLADPRWQRKRLEVMQTANWKCRICGDDKEELNVHHPHYDKGMEPWEYLDQSLQCLCKTCHTISHATKWKFKIHSTRVFEEREKQLLRYIEDRFNLKSMRASLARKYDNNIEYDARMELLIDQSEIEFMELKRSIDSRLSEILELIDKRVKQEEMQ